MCLSCDHAAQKTADPVRDDRNGGKVKTKNSRIKNKSFIHMHIYVYTQCTYTLYIHTYVIVSFLGKLSFDYQFEYHIKYVIWVVTSREHIFIIIAELI